MQTFAVAESAQCFVLAAQIPHFKDCMLSRMVWQMLFCQRA